jgi:hypothetical protein
MNDKMWELLTKHLDRAANAVGVLTLLLTVGVFGISANFFEFRTASLIGLCFFGFSGALEVFHRQRKSDLDNRNQSLDINSLFENMLIKYKKVWHLKIHKEFKYRGLLFRTIGFEEVPEGPVTIAGPLCPTCQGNLYAETETKFPGRHSITFKCLCGFSQKSDRTEPEIIKEVASQNRVPH